MGMRSEGYGRTSIFAVSAIWFLLPLNMNQLQMSTKKTLFCGIYVSAQRCIFSSTLERKEEHSENQGFVKLLALIITKMSRIVKNSDAPLFTGRRSPKLQKHSSPPSAILLRMTGSPGR